MTYPILSSGWQQALGAEFDQPYMLALDAFLSGRNAAGAHIFPPEHQRFAAFDKTPLESVRVVILGQDPYHGAGQAHGLSFSVPPGIPRPPSLNNIFRELQDDLGFAAPSHGCLTHWAEQGVLLLNAVLSVEEGQAAAHAGQGWERFTDCAIAAISRECRHVAFLLWGGYAQKKAGKVDKSRHLVLTSPHPSPLSSYRGFFGSKPFSKINAYLAEQGRGTIDWRLPEPVSA